MVDYPGQGTLDRMGTVKAVCVRLLTSSLALGIIGSMVGCGTFKERVCESGEYAVRAIEAPETGRTCVPNGQEPPPGYERFPPGQTPTYLEDDRP